ncbi:hypothetical protein AgCh_001162 [Apium graveolens]
MVRLRHTAPKSVPGGPYHVEGFRLPEQVVVFLSEKALSPVMAEAMFVNREEVPVYLVYRDPVRFINSERVKLPDKILKHSMDENNKYFAAICLDDEKSEGEV